VGPALRSFARFAGPVPALRPICPQRIVFHRNGDLRSALVRVAVCVLGEFFGELGKRAAELADIVSADVLVRFTFVGLVVEVVETERQ